MRRVWQFLLFVGRVLQPGEADGDRYDAVEGLNKIGVFGTTSATGSR
jgi:hypothetical protein